MIRVIEETHPLVLECDDLISKEMMANVIMRRIVRQMIRLSHVVDEIRRPNFTYDIDDEANQYYATDGCTDEGRSKLRDFMIEYKFILEFGSIELNEKFHGWYRVLVEHVNPDGTMRSKENNVTVIDDPNEVVSDQPENEPAKETLVKVCPRVKILIGSSNTVLENKINDFLSIKSSNHPNFKIVDIKYNVVRVGYYSALIIYEI
jgi:hypothetical protein